MTALDIYNKALAAIGAERFLSSVDAKCVEAVHCRREWEAARISVLGAHEWGWLAEETTYCDGTEIDDDGPVLYSYPRPVGAIKVAAVMDTDGRRIKWTSVNGLIQSETDVAKIRYVPDSETIDDWPIPVQDAVTFELASRIAVPITKNVELMGTMKKLAAAHLADAIQKDSSEVRYGGTNGRKYAEARQ